MSNELDDLIDYLSSWKETLEDDLKDGGIRQHILLSKEQIDYLEKAIKILKDKENTNV